MLVLPSKQRWPDGGMKICIRITEAAINVNHMLQKEEITHVCVPVAWKVEMIVGI